MARRFYFALGIILFAALIFGSFIYTVAHRIDTTTQTSAQTIAAIKCSDRKIADFAAAVGAVFSAPAPAGTAIITPARQKAIEDILKAAKALNSSSHSCPT